MGLGQKRVRKIKPDNRAQKSVIRQPTNKEPLPDIAYRLGQLLEEVGFSNVKALPLNLRGDASNSFVFRGLTEVFANIFESVEQTLGPKLVPKILIATTWLRELPAIEGGAIFYSPVVGRGTRNV